jgi:glycosyltransferase involved in cell wall biosynthesis
VAFDAGAASIKIAISTPGRFHNFDQAAALERAGVLDRIFTGYPPFKLRDTQVSREKISSRWAFYAPAMASRVLPFQPMVAPFRSALFELARRRQDRFVSRNLGDCDGLIALSGSAQNGALAMRRRGRGGVFICDRGSTHVLFQEKVMREEAALLGLRARPMSVEEISRDLTDYAAADAIFTPSAFTRKTFLDQGVPEAKLKLIPYGVDIRAYGSRSAPKADAFTVLFVGQVTYRKGIHYLLEAWSQWAPRAARLRIAGVKDASFPALVRWAGGMPGGVTLLGHLGRADVVREMAAAHVLVLPSIEDGFGLVMAEAMACGTPVIASENTGAETLYTHRREGLIGPVRSAAFLAEAFEALASDPARTKAMAEAALARSATFGNAEAYGRRVMAALREVYKAKGLEA